MTFKPRIWYPIAVVLSVANVVSVWFAAIPGEPLHAATHAALAVGFGLWAGRLRQQRASARPVSDASTLQAGLEALEGEVNALRQELNETQERMDFAERLMAQRPETRRVDPHH